MLAQKKLEIEIWERDIYQKQRVEIDHSREIDMLLEKIVEQENLIEARKLKLEELKLELEEVEKELVEFQIDNQAKNDELVEMENNIQTLLDDKARLEADENEKRRKEQELVKSVPVIKQKYSAVKGDKVDELMAYYINLNETDVPIQRLGDGNYMFGSRKIYSKIMNEKLVVRVGGGFMLIDEFLQTYGKQELEKINAMASRGTSFPTGMSSPGRKGSPTWNRVS